MQTLYFQQHEIAAAGSILRQGGCVAFPTETVYGLGANALNAEAVSKIFQAKGRPSDNPLIVHVSDTEMLANLVTSLSTEAKRLIRDFWPGPLTLVLPKSPAVPDCVTAGLSTVAVRMPDHPWALELIRSAAVPIAAPSANRSGSPSGTTWQAVRDDLDSRVEAILCGPATEIGLESTVLDLSGDTPRILRPGKVTYEDLLKQLPNLVGYTSLSNEGNQEVAHLNSPGLRHRHYQPRARVILWDGQPEIEASPASPNHRLRKYVFIGMQPSLALITADENHCLKVYAPHSIEDYAANLFQFFRTADDLGATTIICQSVPDIGLGAALMDRLRRAAK